MKIFATALSLVATFAASGCSSKSGTSLPDSGGLLAKDAGASAYPAGPYGTGEGSIVEDATFSGYPSFDDATLRAISLHDYYNPDGTKTTTGASGAPLTALFVTVGAVWCSPCVEEAKVLAAVAAKFLPAGVQVIQDLYQGQDRASGAAATQPELDTWVKNYALPFPVFIDPAKKLAPYFSIAELPFIMMIDPQTMRSVGEEVGFGGQQSLEAFICANAPQKLSAVVCP